MNPYAYTRLLPTDNFRTVNSMAPENKPPDLTINGAWDSAGLCGCCGNGRGCAGCGWLCYANMCLPLAQGELSAEIAKIKGETDNPSVLNHMILPVVAAASQNSVDDVFLSAGLAWKLQMNFRQEEHLDKCKLGCMACMCPACLITWAWFTVKNLKQNNRGAVASQVRV